MSDDLGGGFWVIMCQETSDFADGGGTPSWVLPPVKAIGPPSSRHAIGTTIATAPTTTRYDDDRR